MRRNRDLHEVLRFLAATNRRRLLLGALLAACTVLMGMALLGLSGWFISATALAGLGTTAALSFDVFMPSAGIRLLALGRTASRYGERLVTHDATLTALAALRERLFRGWALPEAARALQHRPARLLFRLTADTDAIETLYLRLLVPAAAALGAAALAGGVLGSLHVALGIVVFAWLSLAGWGIALATASRARPASVRRALATESLRSRTIDLIAGQTELAMAGRLAAQRAAIEGADHRLAKADLALNQIELKAGWLYGVSGALTLAAVLLAVAALVERRTIGTPAAALALLVALAAMEPFAALRRGAIEAGRSWLAARRLAPRLAHRPTRIAGAPAPAGVALSVEGASAAHAGKTVLHAVSCRITHGERVALVGASGAGKSTLLALAAGELSPSAGTVRAARGSLLVQRTELFQDSLRDNLRLADPGADDAQLWAALRCAGLAGELEALSAGLDTQLGEGGLGLSGGQAKRLALARLLLRPVDLWLLDEPTEALDSATARDVLARLAAQAQGRTVLVATHLRREAEVADRLLCLSQGRLVADLRRGTPGFDAALAALRPD